MNRRRLLATASAALVGTAGCTGDGNDPQEAPADGEEVRIVEHELVRENVGTEEESVSVHGLATIVEDAEVDYVEIRAQFYDEDGEMLDSTVEHVEDVTGSTRWEFEIEFPYVGERAAAVADYDLEVVTAL